MYLIHKQLFLVLSFWFTSYLTNLFVRCILIYETIYHTLITLVFSRPKTNINNSYSSKLLIYLYNWTMIDVTFTYTLVYTDIALQQNIMLDNN